MHKFILYLLLILPILSYSQDKDILNGLLSYKTLFQSSSDSNVACYRIPALTTAPNGDLIAAIDQRVPNCGDLKYNRNINIVIRRSSNLGNSWSNEEIIVDFPDGQSASDPSFIVDHVTNTIFLFYNFMDLDKEIDVYYFHVITSQDNGLSWSKPIDMTSQISKPEWHNDFKFITSGRGIQTRDGKLLHTLVNLDNGMHVFTSDDQGQNWYLIETPIIPGNESKIVELSDGSWFINSRVNGKGYRYVHYSKDKGKSWTSKADSTLIDPGCNASTISIPVIVNGVERNLLLFSNANSADKRKNMTIRYSLDNGKTWADGKQIYTGSAAYSSITILPNGDVGLFFEKDNYSENVFLRISLDWLFEE